MSRVGDALRHPFWHAVLLLVLAYLLFTAGIAYLPPLLGIRSAPVPASVVVQYMLTALVAILIYVSEDEARWARFKQPIRATLVEPRLRAVRLALEHHARAGADVRLAGRVDVVEDLEEPLPLDLGKGLAHRLAEDVAAPADQPQVALVGVLEDVVRPPQDGEERG